MSEPRTAGLDGSRTAAWISPRTATGWSEPRTAALTSPRTAGLTGGPLTGWTAGWFWLGAGYSPDTGGSLPYSLVLWCLGGPRDDGSWPRARTAMSIQCCRCGQPAELPGVLHKWEEKQGNKNSQKRREKALLTSCFGFGVQSRCRKDQIWAQRTWGTRHKTKQD